MTEAMLEHYVQHGGTVMAIAGPDFALIASDTRSSSNGTIVSNNQLKIFRLPNQTAVGISGNMADSLEVVSRLQAEINRSAEAKGQPLSLPGTAEMLSLLLYERRIFPYYVQVLLVGIDGTGKGGVYSYDPVGHCEKVAYRLHGTSAKFMLASMSYLLSPYESEFDYTDVITMALEELTPVVKDLYTSCSEVDPATGGGCEIWILRPNKEGGVEYETVQHQLRQD
ncbi:proteasome subunit beta type-1-like [Diaphorina citri]|uniref:Proteasome subunit beta n=1 Tax=Diaphorina citri TaxID=121845 RepID=A0A1S3DUL9_DIACI|nr:proteasome subunit beta type-1-like [Diaphorina citri]